MRDATPMDLEAAEQALRRGDAPAALRSAEAARTAVLAQPGWARLQALALVASGRSSEARPYFLRYAQAVPDDADAWVNLGAACNQDGDVEAALDAFGRAGAAGAQGVPYLLGRGIALFAAGHYREAEDWLARAQAIEPDAADIRLSRGQCLAELERYEELCSCVAELSDDGLSFDQRIVLAWLKAQSGLDQAALALYRAILRERPDASEPRVQLALLLERLNRVHEASEVLAPACSTGAIPEPMLALAQARIARRSGDPCKALGALAEAADRERNPALAAQLHFELAKCHDGLDHPDAAVQALSTAHAHALDALQQRHPDLLQSRILGWLDQRLRRPWSPPLAATTASTEPVDPVFLVGFPRSGTTLLEQMLAAHTSLRVLDERPALEFAIAAMQRTPGWRDDDLDGSLAQLADVDVHHLRTRYRAEVARHLPRGGRLVDKYPLYLTRLAHASRLFPQSDWLLLLRHPCDCVLSCHFQAFGLNGGALAFASLESTARTYVEVMGYWDEQRRLVGPRVHVLRYEDLASDPVRELGALMAFLSLPVEPAQLQFQRAVTARSRRINTPSYAQVAEPVHQRAVGRWRRYRGHFTPNTLALLAPWAERYGYALD